MNEKESAAAEINPPVCLIYDRKLKISQYFCLSLQVQHSVFFLSFFSTEKKKSISFYSYRFTVNWVEKGLDLEFFIICNTDSSTTVIRV